MIRYLNSKRTRFTIAPLVAVICGSIPLWLACPTFAQQSVQGRLTITDPNVMRDLDNFEIVAFGFSDERRSASSPIRTTQANSNGEFEILLLSYGSIVAAYSDDRTIVGWTWMDDDHGTIEVGLERAVQISGRLVQAENGEPLKSYRVMAVNSITRSQENRSALGGMGITDAEGRFEITGLLPRVPYVITLGLEPFDPKNAVGHRSRAICNFETSISGTWRLPDIPVTLDARSGIKTVEPLWTVDTSVPLETPRAQAEVTLRTCLAKLTDDQTGALVYYRGRQTSWMAEVDGLMLKLQDLFGDRLPLAIIDSRQPSAHEVMSSIDPSWKNETTWMAVDSDGDLVKSGWTRSESSPPLFDDRQVECPLNSPPTVDRLLQLIQLAVPDVTTDELTTVANWLGYKDHANSLPTLRQLDLN